jgi:hypothetical protein
MIAFKWLAAGAVAPFTGVRWPRTGWLLALPGDGCGIHACRIADLPWWIDAELWRVELAGPVVERDTQVEAARARLLDQITAWDPRAFAYACAGRAAAFAAELKTPELSEYASISATLHAAGAAYVAAVAAVAARGNEKAFADERAWQAQWLARTLQIGDTLRPTS